MTQDAWKMVMAVALTAMLACTGTYAVVSNMDDDTGHRVIGTTFPVMDLGAYTANELFELNDPVSGSEISRFANFDDFKAFREKHSVQSYYGYNYAYSDDRVDAVASESAAPMGMSGSGGNDYYTDTNIQVTGVDEGDIVKNDGKYAYIISGTGESAFIVLAYPPEQASILCEIETRGTFIDMYVEENMLIMLEQVYYFEGGFSRSGYMYSNSPMINLKVFDISNRSAPTLADEATLAGNYLTSRLIEGKMYVMGNLYIRDWENESQLPMPLESLYYLENDDGAYSITSFLTFDLDDEDSAPSIMGVVMSSSNNIYVSSNNIYITHGQYREAVGLLGDFYESSESTVIHRIGIQGQSLKYKARGEVDGRLLNRYSMDEFDGHFRVATTKGWSWGQDSKNMVHVLDMALEPTGILNDIAPGEQIYSARFMGTRLYLVTFRQVDPFYVIDLHDAENPKILGELKIPGYSTYLHPYDDDHIIGLGKDGSSLKIALFNVSDVNNPTTLDTWTFGNGNGYSDSQALYDPHAFMFSREKNILVIPIEGYSYDYHRSGSTSGAYVFEISPESGITQIGSIEHESGDMQEQDYYGYYYHNHNPVKRSFIVNDTLYTVSNLMMKANEIQNLNAQASIELN